MDINEIKKVLYKEKPTVYEIEQITGGGSEDTPEFANYVAKTSIGEIHFKVPFKEMGEDCFGEDRFDEEIPAQLLIRWLNVDK